MLGPVASPPTVWRALDELTPARLTKVAAARARTRRHVWALLPGGVPASQVAGTDLGEVVVLDVDATVVITHSEKEHAAATFKKTFGYHPIGVWCDNTGEFLAARLRAGNAGSNTTADHIQVLSEAISQVPGTHRRHLLIRSDGAGASHGLLDWLTEQGQVRGRSVEYSIGFAVTEKIRRAISLVPATVWSPATNADGGVREGGDVAEVTGLLDLSGWPTGMRVIARRERPHPGAQLSLFEDADGWRYQAFVTNTATGQARRPGGPPPGARTSRGPYPARQRHRAGTVPLPGVCDQYRVADNGHDRGRSDRLDPATRPDRRRHDPVTM